jgi:hypothetical protein
VTTTDEVVMLAVPVLLVLALGAIWAAVDSRRWTARCRAASEPQPVELFPSGIEPLAPVLDVHAGRAARRARHGGTPR